MAGLCSCGATWSGLLICHCGACHLTFTSIGAFDFHRYRERCRTGAELREKGYEPNSHGHWRKPDRDGRWASEGAVASP